MTRLHRRTLLGGMAAAAALAPMATFAAGRRMKVGVVGGGIIGASTALQLARAGADVTVFEKTEPAAGATRNSVAWINPVVNNAHYMQLRLESMKAWLEDDSQLKMNAIWGGSISWAYGDKKKDELKVKADLLAATDDPPRILTLADVTRVAPGVFPGDEMSFAFQTVRDGHVDPVFATQRYLAAAKRNGAKVIYPCEVTAVEMQGGTLVGVNTTKGRFPLDHLISATGTDTPRIMSMVEKKLELVHKPGLVVHTTPQPVVTRAVFEASSIIEFKQYADGRFLTSFTGGPPNAPQHVDILDHQMQYPDEYLRQHHGQMLIDRTAKYIPAIAKGKPTKILLGFRPYPLDNRPICGPVPGAKGLYVIVTHSGITLAPILGRYAAQEIMSGHAAPMLQPYRPDRYIAA